MGFIIWCDESDSDGKFYSNFYGGALVRTKDHLSIIDSLENKKIELNLFNEIKWQKVTQLYLDKYIQLMDLFFNYVKDDKIKIRIMFTQNAYVPQNLTCDQRENEYTLLYYQFIKHAFGIQHSNNSDNFKSLRINFDDLPDNDEKVEIFKNHIFSLNKSHEFKRGKIKIHWDDISEVKSHDHVVLQCLDVVLGSISFRLNDKHKEKPAGSKKRGKRTIAKEKLYKFMLKKIRETRSGFNIGISTGTNDISDYWNHPYRHWNFKSNNHKIDNSRFKK
jgi:hypothetical protein